MDNFELVKQKINLMDYVMSTTQLKRRGKSWVGNCPLHGERTPSFYVYPQTQSFMCYGCRVGGTIIDFVMAYQNIRNPSEALELIAREKGIMLEREDDDSWKQRKEIISKNSSKAKTYVSKSEEIDTYLNGRGISKETKVAFGLGYVEGRSKAVSIPFFDTYGEVSGFSFRMLDPEAKPKYINSSEDAAFKKGEMLYGMDKARKEIDDSVYVVEGYFDVMSLHQRGIKCAVGYCSSSITTEQALLLSKYITDKTKIYLIPDNDSTGQDTIKKNVETIKSSAPKNQVRILPVPDDCKDFNDFHLTGRDFRELKSQTSDMYLLKWDLDHCADIEDEYEVSREYATSTRNKMVRAEMAQYLAERWDKPIEVVNSHMETEGSIKNYADDLITFSQALEDYRAFIKQGDEGKVYFGLSALDFVIKGMRKREVCTILGRSGSGKTTLILNLIYNAIFKQNHHVIFNSIELSREMIALQILQIAKGFTEKEVEKTFGHSMEDFSDYDILKKLDDHLRIVDADRQSLNDVEMYAKTANTIFENPVSLIVIDYFQSLHIEGKRSGYEEKSEAARELKRMAKRLDCVIVDLSQSNRAVGKSGGNKLSMDGARDTGAIEEASDYMIGIYRPSSNPELSEDERKSVEDEMYAQILKNRWGRQCEVKLHFDGMIKQIGDAR